MKIRTNFVVVAVLATFTFSIVSSQVLAQGSIAQSHGGAAINVTKQVSVQNDKLFQALTDPHNAYHQVTLANGVALGANIPGRLLVGPLNQPPTVERNMLGIFYTLLIVLGAAWSLSQLDQIAHRDET